MRRLLLPLFTILLALAPAGAAFAAAPDAADDEVVYAGTAMSVHANGVADPTRDTVFTLSCADASCEIVDELTYFPEPIVFIDGVAAYEFPAEGDGCDGSGRVRAIHIALQASPSSITGTLIYDDRYPTGCPNGMNRVYGTTTTLALDYVSGETCLLDASCATEEVLTATAPDSGVKPRPFTAPTVFSELPTAAEAASVPNLLWAAAGTVILALLITIPTHFLNSAMETFADRVKAWWQRLRRRPQDSVPGGGISFAGWPIAAGGVLVAAVIAAFADPGFAFDAAGLRVLLSIVASFAIEVGLGWVAVVLLVRRTHPGAAASPRFAPLSLLIVVAAVVVTRVTGFEPPIVFGLVAGVAFGGLLGTADRARVTLIGLGWSFGIGLLAWLGYSILAAVGTPSGGGIVVSELLSAAAIAGISALPIALLPLRGLAGRSVWEWKRAVWAGAFGVGLFTFLLVLLPLPSSWATVGLGLWTWVGLFVAYAVISVVIWAGVTRPWKKAASAA